MQVERDPNKQGVGRIVLIVDDNLAIRQKIATAFLSDGFKTCIEAGDGKEAIDVAKQFGPDIIILDLSMPIMNGLEAASELRRLYPQLPMILFTMYGDDSIEAQALAAGINLVLPKSGSISRLLDKAHELLG